MQGFEDFIEFIFSKQHLLIFIIFLLILIFVVIFMLIKLQYSMSKNGNEENELDLAFNNEENEDYNHTESKIIVEEPKLEKIDDLKEIEEIDYIDEEINDNEEEIIQNNSESLEDLLDLEFEQISKHLKEDNIIKNEDVLNETIKKEEAKDDESSAIISNTELINKQKNLKEELGFDNETIIRAYEEEQEKKAIISYEELLKNAQALRDTFKIPTKERRENQVSISPIEFETTELRVTSYIVEEEFLNTLKKFRLNLK